MAQWESLCRNERFIHNVNPMQLYILCEKSGALQLAEPGLTEGRQAGRLASKQNAASNF